MKAWQHFKTITHHRWLVCRGCFKIGLIWHGLTHDLSKYSHTEFWNGVKYFTGTASPHIGERKVKGYSDAWLHHHNRNKHHAEYWVDIVNGKSTPIKVPFRYLAEMICDRVAASMIYLKDKYTDAAPFDYFKSHLDENQFHEDTKRELVDWLATIELYGLDKTLKQLKMELQMEKNYEKYIRS